MITFRFKSDPQWLRAVNQIGGIIFMMIGAFLGNVRGGTWSILIVLIGSLLGALVWMMIFLPTRYALITSLHRKP